MTDLVEPPSSVHGAEVARLRSLLRRSGTATASVRPAPARRPALGLEHVETPHGPALRRVEEIRVPVTSPPGIVYAARPGTIFLDTETTGLAGGTGTYVFLVGLGTWTGTGLRVTQFFLGDLAGEAAFLAAVREAVVGAAELVTFNGRSFDLPLLETRYLLARAPWWGPEVPHLDLYPLARTLWREHVPDCRLTTLEAALLRLDRAEDVPGALMPQLYFRYLRSQDPSVLPQIFGHNSWDLIALVGLAGRAQGLLAGPHAHHDPLELLGAARWLEGRDAARSAQFYAAALEASAPAAFRARIAWRLGWLWRRTGRWADALRLWAGVVETVDEPPLGLLVDLAKLYEHRVGDFRAALAVTQEALRRVERGPADELRVLAAEALWHRASRLERRLSAQGGGRAAPLSPRR